MSSDDYDYESNPLLSRKTFSIVEEYVVVDEQIFSQAVLIENYEPYEEQRGSDHLCMTGIESTHATLDEEKKSSSNLWWTTFNLWNDVIGSAIVGNMTFSFNSS